MKRQINKISTILYDKPQYIFYIVSAAGIVLFFLFALLGVWDVPFDWLIMQHNSDYVMSDHIRHIQFGAKLERAYHMGGDKASFPALAYCIYHVLYEINPMDLTEHYWATGWHEAPYAIILYIILIIFVSLIFQYIIGKIVKKSHTEILLLSCLLIFSLPYFAGAIERGNNAYPVIVLLCVAIYLKDSDNKFKRELALLFIAIAASIKIYPAILGLLYIREKRWKEVLRLMIYGIIIFFVPFIFTDGLNGLKTYIGYLVGYNNSTIMRWMSIRGFCTYVGATGRIPGVTVDLASIIGSVIEKIFLIAMLIGAFITEKKWKQLFYLTMPMSYYVVNNYRYTAVYLTLPLLFLIAEKHCEKGRDRVFLVIYMILFGMIFTIPAWGYAGDAEHWMSGAAFVLCAMVVVEEIILKVAFIKKERLQS